MLNVNALAYEIREIGEGNGFNLVYRPDWSSSDYHVPTLLALIHSEIVEAYAEYKVTYDAYAEVDRDKLAAEFADIQIRILDLAGGLTEDFAFYVKYVDEAFISSDIEAAFNSLHQGVTFALEAFRADDFVAFLGHLAKLYFKVDYFAAHQFAIDMAQAVPAKIEVNRHRSHRHGGKRI